jgi:hypothetical protein
MSRGGPRARTTLTGSELHPVTTSLRSAPETRRKPARGSSIGEYGRHVIAPGSPPIAGECPPGASRRARALPRVSVRSPRSTDDETVRATAATCTIVFARTTLVDGGGRPNAKNNRAHAQASFFAIRATRLLCEALLNPLGLTGARQLSTSGYANPFKKPREYCFHFRTFSK